MEEQAKQNCIESTTCAYCGKCSDYVRRTKPFGQPDAGWACSCCIKEKNLSLDVSGQFKKD